jgi:hypothetical protein
MTHAPERGSRFAVVSFLGMARNQKPIVLELGGS